MNTPVKSGTSGLVERAKAILTQPSAQWPAIAGESESAMQAFLRYAVPLAAIGPVCALIGGQLFGYGWFGFSYRPGLGAAVSEAVGSYVVSLIGLFIVAFIANFLAPKFGGTENWDRAFRLVTYSMTAAWLAGVFNLVPSLAFLTLLGLYGIYLFYTGAGPMMAVPKDKTAAYTAVTIVVAILVNLVLGGLIALVMGVGNAVPGSITAAADEGSGTVSLGDYGTVTVDGDEQTIDMGEFGQVRVDGDTATVTVDGQEYSIPVEAAE